MDMDLLWSPLLMAAQFFIAMALYARAQPRRPRFWARVGAVAVAYLAGTVAVTYVGYVAQPSLMEENSLASQITVFCALALLWVVIVWLCFDLTPTASAFIAIAGYSTENLADSLGGVVQIARSELTGLWPVDEAGDIATSVGYMSDVGLVVSLVCTALAYAFCWHFFARRLTGAWASKPRDAKIALTFIATLFLEVAFDLALKSVFGLDMNAGQRLILSGCKPVICLFVLFCEFEVLLGGRMEADMDSLVRVMAERERQYELQAANIEAVNVKVHDIKHQIRSLAGAGGAVDAQALAELAHEVRVFDTSVKTGNDAVDTILTEKSLVCEREKITLSCVVDGAALAFLSPTETYSLFGNALDNAIRAAKDVADPDRRSISLTVSERAGMATLHVENYFEGTVEFADGLPRTTTGDEVNHGFGTRSMRMLAESHGGAFSASAKDGVFYLNVMLPVPDA